MDAAGRLMIIRAGAPIQKPSKNRAELEMLTPGRYFLRLGDVEDSVFVDTEGLVAIRDLINAELGTGEQHKEECSVTEIGMCSCGCGGVI